MKIRFLSSNPHKIEEIVTILEPVDVEVVPVSSKIDEIQTADVQALVRDKCIKAFQEVGRPLFVEHTGLKIKALNDFPGGLTQIFWDTIQADRFSELFGNTRKSVVVAETLIGFCDGRCFHYFKGRVSGTIPQKPRGDRAFQWDCVFVPKNSTKTFAEMGPKKKNKISMRKKALDKFAKFLRERHG